MPPPDYNRVRKVVPPGGVAAAPTPMTPEERAYLDQMKASREPWSSYLPRTAKDIGTNLYNTGKAFLPTALGGEGAVGITDIAKGAAEAAYDAGTLPGDALTGRVQLFDPMTGLPTDEAVQRSTDFAGTVTLSAGAIPAEANALRMGASTPAETNPPRQGPLLHPQKRPDGYYSKAEKALLSWPQQAGTAEQFRAFLEKNGVKKPEIEAMGLDKLTGKVDKTQLLAQLARNEPRITVETTNSFESDTMPGGTNYRMLNVKWENPDITYGMIPYRYIPHQLPDNTLVYARLKDDVYTGADGQAKKVLRVEELQSDWAQQGKGKWALPADPKRIKMEKVPLDNLPDELVKRRTKQIKEDPSIEPQLRELARAIIAEGKKRGDTTATFYRVDGVNDNGWSILGSGDTFTPEELLKEGRDTFGEQLKTEGSSIIPLDAVQEMLWNEQFGQAPAPYVSQGSAGIVPLALKEILKQAAQGGQDEIVFAPGKVHANRWAENDPKRAAGLTDFYDNILPKEVGAVLKDLEKETGIEGLKGDVEDRPFIKARDNGPDVTNPQQNMLRWYQNQGTNQLIQLLDFPIKKPPGDYTDATDKMAYIRQLAEYTDSVDKFKDLQSSVFTQVEAIKMDFVRGNSIDYSVAQRGEHYNNKKIEYEEKVAKLQARIDAIENKPNTEMTEGDFDSLNILYDMKDKIQIDLDFVTNGLEAMKMAHKLAKHWEKNVYQPHNPNQPKAMVIKLTPELRDYINKNGLPRFAKGGIVDLAIHGAHNAFA
jgi:hypothetical protein